MLVRLESMLFITSLKEFDHLAQDAQLIMKHLNAKLYKNKALLVTKKLCSGKRLKILCNSLFVHE